MKISTLVLKPDLSSRTVVQRFFNDIKADVIVKYNNICKRLKKENKNVEGRSQDNFSSSAKENDSDKAKIIALTTQLEQAQQLMSFFASNFK